jgi:8-oxo-dGDP phosphatase
VRQESSRPVYSNPWVSLREDRISLPDGSPGTYSVLDAPDFALVVPFENDGFHLVEQYRYPVRARSWEFPSGAFPPGETGTPTEMATAELREETGFTAGRLERLGFVNPANGFMSLGCHVFLATELTPGEPAREATEQDMRQEWFPRAELERMLRDGEITDGPSIAAYLLFQLRT